MSNFANMERLKEILNIGEVEKLHKMSWPTLTEDYPRLSPQPSWELEAWIKRLPTLTGDYPCLSPQPSRELEAWVKRLPTLTEEYPGLTIDPSGESEIQIGGLIPDKNKDSNKGK